MNQHAPSPDDVRMRGFTRRTTVADALKWLDDQTDPLGQETIPLAEAAGRVLADEITSRVNVPSFDRSMMDGFALRAADAAGASTYNRLALDVIGQSMPGRPFAGSITAGTAVRIMTGAPVPGGADAVLPVEQVEIQENRILIQGDVSPGKHIGAIGEDVSSGSVVLSAGRTLRPQDIGMLASIGAAEIPVIRRPNVRIVVTGNELLPAGSAGQENRIVDSNGPMLAALTARDGGLPDHPGIVPDQPEAVLEAMRSDADVILVSGGSSVGQEDYAPALLREHGELPIHGVTMRPGSPSGMGRLADAPIARSQGLRNRARNRLVFLMPGNPVACLCSYDMFAGRAIRLLGGRQAEWPYRSVTMPLARKLVSTVGRIEFARVRVRDEKVEPLTVGGSSVLSSTTRADGFVLIPTDSEGYPPETPVEVFLYNT